MNERLNESSPCRCAARPENEIRDAKPSAACGCGPECSCGPVCTCGL